MILSVVSGSKEGGRGSVTTVGFIFFGVSSFVMLPFTPSVNRTRRPLLAPLSFFFGRLAVGVAVVFGGGLIPTSTTGSIFSCLILIVGIRFLFAASVSSDEMVLSELGGIVRGAAMGCEE